MNIGIFTAQKLGDETCIALDTTDKINLGWYLLRLANDAVKHSAMEMIQFKLYIPRVGNICPGALRFGKQSKKEIEVRHNGGSAKAPLKDCYIIFEGDFNQQRFANLTESVSDYLASGLVSSKMLAIKLSKVTERNKERLIDNTTFPLKGDLRPALPSSAEYVLHHRCHTGGHR